MDFTDGERLLTLDDVKYELKDAITDNLIWFNLFILLKK